MEKSNSEKAVRWTLAILQSRVAYAANQDAPPEKEEVEEWAEMLIDVNRRLNEIDGRRGS